MRKMFAAFLLTVPFSAAALADNGDSSASAAEGFRDAVVQSEGVILRVPVNASGEVNTNAAEMRLVSVGIDASSDSALVAAFDSATAIPQAAIDVSGDSSTSGCGWGNYYGGYSNGYYGYGYQPSYYYSSYSPYYSYNHYSYGYSYSNSYANYYYPSYGNYNYYYYPRNDYYSYGGHSYHW